MKDDVDRITCEKRNPLAPTAKMKLPPPALRTLSASRGRGAVNAYLPKAVSTACPSEEVANGYLELQQQRP